MSGWRFADLVADLRALGVRPGQDLLVHSSLRSVGPIAGRAATLLDALRAVAGPAATIVVPTHTAGNSGSSTRFLAATRELDRAGVARYLASLPGFDSRTTPSQGMGAFAEYVRTRPGAARSGHPQTSFAAIGARAAECTRVHDLNCHFGRCSPLGWLFGQDAAVLLLGVGYASFTAFHLAEYLLPEDRLPPGKRPTRAYHCFTQTGSERRSDELWDMDLDESDFAILGSRMDAMSFVSRGRIGAAACRLIPIRRAVQFAMSDPDFQRRRSVPAPDQAAASASRARMHGGGADAAVAASGRYFYLSYPRVPPLPVIPGIDVADPPDEWVRAFFRDLNAEVSRRAAPGTALRPGFLGGEVPAGSHWQSGLADALGVAQVFVPLLSGDYYRRSWNKREWMAFERRMRDTDPAAPAPAPAPAPAGEANPRQSQDPAAPLRRFAPVLWEPLPPGERPPGAAAALSLATAGTLRPYADLGLRTLLRLSGYHWCYQQILGELSNRIVTLAEQAPIEPSPVSIPAVTAPFGEPAGGRVLTVTVCGRHGQAGAPPAEYVRLAAERLGFAVLIRKWAVGEEEFVRYPGVFLVEPGAAGDDGLLRDCDTVIAGLPPWVLPVILTARTTGQPGQRHDKIRFILKESQEAYMRRPDIVRQGIAGVSSLPALASLMPFLIAHAEREYLRHSPISRATSRPVFRPRLAGGGPAAGWPGKEDPDV